jgi:hypothetical protein
MKKIEPVTEALGQTDMGRDLLAQDYILKQLTASLIYPEKELGKKFWDNVYQKTQAKYGNVNIPVNTFNKVWIMADKAEVFERNQTVFVTDSHLKVMLEEDYLATKTNVGADLRVLPKHGRHNNTTNHPRNHPSRTRERNQHRQKLCQPRQIFNSIILASWYKNNLKQSLLNQVYADKSKVKGIETNDKTINKRIYERYVQAYKKGVFNYVKEGNTPKKYFSGGVVGALTINTVSQAMASKALLPTGDNDLVSIKVVLQDTNLGNFSSSDKATLAQDIMPLMDANKIDAVIEKLKTFQRSGHKESFEPLFKMLVLHPNYQALITKLQKLLTENGRINSSWKYYWDEIQRVRKELNPYKAVEFNGLLLPANEWLLAVNKLWDKFTSESVESMSFDIPTQSEIEDPKIDSLKKVTRLMVSQVRKAHYPRTYYLRFVAMFLNKEEYSRRDEYRNWLIATSNALLHKHQDFFIGRLDPLRKSNPPNAAMVSQKPDLLNNDLIDQQLVYAVTNAAMSATGGIDLKDSFLKTNVKKQGNGVEFMVDPLLVERLKRQGIENLAPVILTITPGVNIHTLLGLHS